MSKIFEKFHIPNYVSHVTFLGNYEYGKRYLLEMFDLTWYGSKKNKTKIILETKNDTNSLLGHAHQFITLKYDLIYGSLKSWEETKILFGGDNI